jgi:hypothetical protein
MNLGERSWEGVGWIHLAQDTSGWLFWTWYYWTFRFCKRQAAFLRCWVIVSFSRRTLLHTVGWYQNVHNCLMVVFSRGF